MPKKNLDPIPVAKAMQLGSFKKLCEKAQRLNKINDFLAKTLPCQLKPHCKLINYELGSLIIAVSNNAIATQLYYQQNNILDSMRKQLTDINLTQIKIRVRQQNY